MVVEVLNSLTVVFISEQEEKWLCVTSYSVLSIILWTSHRWTVIVVDLIKVVCTFYL